MAVFWTETFEGANSGCDNAPTTMTADPDSTTYVYSGSHGLELSGTDLAQWTLASSYDEFWVSFAFKWTTQGGYSGFVGANPFRALKSDSTVLATLEGYLPSSLSQTFRVSQTGGTTSGGVTCWYNTEYLILVHVKKGTGANALIEAWITTDGDFSGSSTISSTDGTWTDQVNKYQHYAKSPDYGDITCIDYVRFYNSAPPSFFEDDAGEPSLSPSLSPSKSPSKSPSPSPSASPSPFDGSTCWGHQTAIEITQDNIRTFAGNWTGTGEAQGSGDAEVLALNAGESMVSEMVHSGVGLVTLAINQYNTGDNAIISYKQGATSTACASDSWHTYSAPFESAGYVMVRVASPGQSDSFAYSDGELETVSSANWERWNNGAGAPYLNILSGKVKYESGTGDGIYVHKTAYPSGNVYAQFTLDTSITTGQDLGLVLNAQGKGDGTQDGYICSIYYTDPTKRIGVYRILNGDWTLLGSVDTTTGYADGDVFRFQNEGGTLKVYKNGTIISGLTVFDATYTAGRVGIFMYSTCAGARIDNWEGGHLPPIVVTDSFTYSDGVLETVSSGVWERWDTNVNAGYLNVLSNMLKFGSGTASGTYAHRATFSSRNVYSQFKLAGTIDAAFDACLFINAEGKGDETWDGYMMNTWTNVATQTLAVSKITNGVWGSPIASDTTTGFAVGDVFKFANEYGTLKTYKNGVLISGLSVADSTYTAGRVGVNIYIDATTGRVDDWEGGDI